MTDLHDSNRRIDESTIRKSYSRLPYGVGHLLDGAIGRIRRLRLLCGLSVTGFVALVGIVAVMVVDSRIVIFDDLIRYAMTAGAALLTLLAALFAIVIPLRRRIDLVKMARRFDALHPEFEERISTLVELAGSDPHKIGYSASLYALVGELAEGDVGKVDLKRDFPSRVTKVCVGVFLALLLILLGGIVASPDVVGRLFLRATMPWLDIGNVFSKNIVVKPGDIVTLSGSVIRIEASPANLQSSVFNLQSSTTNSQSLTANNYSIRLSRKTRFGWSEETSEAMAGGVYQTTADINEREWRYRVTSGPAVTKYYYVRVSLMPKYDRFTATVTYPDYTRKAPLVVSNDAVGVIKAIEGSRVRFGVEISDRGTISDFRIAGEPVDEYAMVSNRSAKWSLDLVNADGFRAEKGRGSLMSFVDQPPSVVIEKPTGTLKLPPHAKIPVEITASDDVGVASVYFRVSIDGEPWDRHHGTRMKEASGESLYRTVADLDLALYDLLFAKSISFAVVAEDACPPEYGGPHAVTSTPFTVQFNANESNWAMKELHQEMIVAQQDIDEAKRRLSDAKALAQQVKNEVKNGEKVSESTEQKSERLAHEISEAEKRIDELKNEFMEDERFASLTRPMDRILDEMLKPVLEKVENASFQNREDRAKTLEESVPEMAKAFDALDDLTKQLKERGDKVDQFEKAKDIAARQEALARAAKEILAEKPADTAKLEAWKQLEEAALRKVDEFAKSKPDSDFAEAKRKMETAAREMGELKKEIDAAQAAAEKEKREAAEREKREKAEAERVAKELEAAAIDEKKALDALDAQKPPEAAAAQRSAEDHLKRANALPSVKALQHFATEASQRASVAFSRQVQQDAADALRREREVREAIAKGTEKKEALKALDDELRKDLAKKSAALEEAVKAAKALELAKIADEKKKAEAKAAAEREEAAKKAAADKKAAAESAHAKDLTAAEEAQAKAEKALKSAGERRAEERKQRRAGEGDEATVSAKAAEEYERQAGEAQKKAAESLKKGAATEGTQALQKLANDTAADARKAPRTAKKAARATAAQEAARAALKNEREIREAIAKGEKTEADLEAMDRAYRELAAEKEAERAKEAADEERRRREREANASRTAQELSAASGDQKRAEQALAQAAASREQERQFRAAKNENAANAKAAEAERYEAQAAEAQRNAGDRLERVEAMPAVKALQQLATAAARNARKAPRTAEKAQAAAAAQKEATEALGREREIREGMRKGERTEEDLAALQDELNAGLAKRAAERTAAAKAAAEAAAKKARAAVGEAEAKELGTLAEQALAARQEAVEAQLDESELKGDEVQADALDDAESSLDSVRTADAEATAREEKIRSMQKSALEALERGDRNRAISLQGEIGRAQARALDATEKESDAEEARTAANEAQEAAKVATEQANRSWNEKTKAAAVEAQKAAMAKEEAAAEEARAQRALDKLAAAEETGNAEPETGSPKPEAGNAEPETGSPAASAREAADAMKREVKSQAAALGMSRQGQSQEQKGDGEKAGDDEKDEDSEKGGKGDKKKGDKKGGGGGDVSDEVKALAKELKRNDNPDFFKSLFSRQGWFKINSISKDGLGAGDLKDVPPEYRDLVRRYFLKLSEDNPVQKKQ